MSPKSLLAAVLMMGCSLCPQAAEVKIDFIEPERYTDVGFGLLERSRNIQTLAAHMQAWAEFLPPAQSLTIEVLDVDLAGHPDRWGWPQRTRLITGGADSPAMHLRWTLREGDLIVGFGEDHLRDLGYLWRIRQVMPGGPLPYDRRMLDDWLRLAVLRAAAR